MNVPLFLTLKFKNMATAKLSGFVTEIAGSVGGTTFKRSPYGLVIINKSRGASKNRLLNNPGFLELQSLRNQWQNLSIELKEGWNTKATEVSFPNKFGNMVYISGYQLYIKANHILYKVDLTMNDPEEFSTFWEDFEITDFEINEPGKVCDVQIQTGEVSQIFAFRFDVTRGPLKKPIYNRSEKLLLVDNSDKFTVDLSTEFYAKYPNCKDGDHVRVYVSTTSRKGATSPEKILETIIVK
jgi:hypothetical protein